MRQKLSTMRQKNQQQILLIKGLRNWAVIGTALTAFLFLSPPAWADKYVYVLKSNLVSAIDGTKAQPLDIEIKGRCKDGRAIYRITNNGGTWPTRGTLEIIRSYGKILGYRKLIVRRHFKLRAGGTVTFKINFKGKPYKSLDMRFKPEWLAQKFQHTFRHTPNRKEK